MAPKSLDTLLVVHNREEIHEHCAQRRVPFAGWTNAIIECCGLGIHFEEETGDADCTGDEDKLCFVIFWFRPKGPSVLRLFYRGAVAET